MTTPPLSATELERVAQCIDAADVLLANQIDLLKRLKPNDPGVLALADAVGGTDVQDTLRTWARDLQTRELVS